MPSKSRRQANYFAMLAHNPEKAREQGVPLKVAKEFNRADKGRGIIGPRKPKNRGHSPIHNLGHYAHPKKTKRR